MAIGRPRARRKVFIRQWLGDLTGLSTRQVTRLFGPDYQPETVRLWLSTSDSWRRGAESVVSSRPGRRLTDSVPRNPVATQSPVRPPIPQAKPLPLAKGDSASMGKPARPMPAQVALPTSMRGGIEYVGNLPRLVKQDNGPLAGKVWDRLYFGTPAEQSAWERVNGLWQTE